MKSSVLLAIASAIFLTLLALPANAQATRTFVSGVGDDANPCSRTAPCKTFAGAIAKTAPAGEINVLDPGGFGAVTITKAITISAEGVEAGVLVSGTNGIVVSAGATDQVVLKGLDIEGLGTGLNGVNFTSGGTLYIVKCSIHNFLDDGVNVNSNTAGARVFITDSLITENGTAAGVASVGGVNVQGNGVANSATLMNSLVDGNKNFAVQSNTGNSVALVRTVLSGSPAGIANLGTANIISFGPGNIITGTGAVTTTNAYK